MSLFIHTRHLIQSLPAIGDKSERQAYPGHRPISRTLPRLSVSSTVLCQTDMQHRGSSAYHNSGRPENCVLSCSEGECQCLMTKPY